MNLPGLAGLWTVYNPAMFRGKILKDSSELVIQHGLNLDNPGLTYELSKQPLLKSPAATQTLTYTRYHKIKNFKIGG